MKSSFIGYYWPTSEQYERLWREAVIVLDTNVLLDLYRLPTTARDELLTVLELLKERLWIPYQVALEFQRRRLTVISAERKSTEDALASASDLVGQLKRRVDSLQIDKRSLGIQAQPLLDDLQQANARLIEAIETVHRSQLDISASDPVREKLDTILEGRIGTGPITQAELDLLVLNGEERFKDKIPPGFGDSEKERNPNEASFIHDHLKYQRKFGDLILWRQLVQYAKASNLKVVLLVTAEKKEDWWWREQGKTMGPLPELVREIYREASVELFWMYSSVQFVEHANKYAAARVSSESVAEIQQVLSSPAHRLKSTDRALSATALMHDFGHREFLQPINMRKIEEAVAAWLRETQGEVQVNRREFPDFLVRQGEDIHGYEIKFLRHFARMLFSPVVVNGILRGYLETKEGRLSELTMIIVIREEDLFQIVESGQLDELHRRLASLLARYPITEMVIGSVIAERFEPLASERGSQQRRYLEDYDQEP